VWRRGRRNRYYDGIGILTASDSTGPHLSSLRSFFFFSSRRRHTRFSRDWSSDVCSSDLARQAEVERPQRALARPGHQRVEPRHEIGRASCRERVQISGVAVSSKKQRRRQRWTRKDIRTTQSGSCRLIHTHKSNETTSKST